VIRRIPVGPAPAAIALTPEGERLFVLSNPLVRHWLNRYLPLEPLLANFAGPTWQAKDGSTVVGHAEASVSVDPPAIPGMRLSAASTTPGQLGSTTNIQRIATTGGIAPPAADRNEITAGTLAEVPYTADYYFWK
jgi:hypothetical protein